MLQEAGHYPQPSSRSGVSSNPSRGVSEEPVLNMIVESPSSHLLKSLVDNREHLFLPMVTISHESVFERVSLRKLRLKAKSTVVNVKIDRDSGSNILGKTLRKRVSSRPWNTRRLKLASNLPLALRVHIEY